MWLLWKWLGGSCTLCFYFNYKSVVCSLNYLFLYFMYMNVMEGSAAHGDSGESSSCWDASALAVLDAAGWSSYECLLCNYLSSQTYLFQEVEIARLTFHTAVNDDGLHSSHFVLYMEKGPFFSWHMLWFIWLMTKNIFGWNNPLKKYSGFNISQA